MTGYINHTVPVALHAWWSYPDDFRLAVQAVIRCGGDADSTGAIVGGIAGARLGQENIPATWRRTVANGRRDLQRIERLSAQLASAMEDGLPRRGVPLSVFGIFPRTNCSST